MVIQLKLSFNFTGYQSFILSQQLKVVTLKLLRFAFVLSVLLYIRRDKHEGDGRRRPGVQGGGFYPQKGYENDKEVCYSPVMKSSTTLTFKGNYTRAMPPCAVTSHDKI